MVALVTGDAGFLGRHIVAALAADGWDVVGAGRPAIEIPSAEFDRLLADARPTLLVHAAGPASVPRSVEDPAGDFLASTGVLVGVLTAASRLVPSPRVIQISSAAVYGEPARLPSSESDETRPLSPYGYHRLACELCLREFYELYDVQSVALRVFSAYGEGLRRQVFWDICRKAMSEGEVRLGGTGAESRDFVHAHDVAHAVSVVARSGKFESEVYNVGTGLATPIAELARLLVDGLGIRAPIVFSGSPRTGDPRSTRADMHRIRALGFEPSVALADGAARYAAWARRELAVLQTV